MVADQARRPLPPWLRYALGGGAAAAAILAALVVHRGALALPWTVLVGVVALLAAMLLLP
jgi:hypothetical protein